MSAIRATIREYRDAYSRFTPNAKRFLLGNALVWIASNLVQLLFNLYLQASGYAEGAIGGLLSTRALGSALIALPASLFIARLSPARLLPAAAVFSGLAYAGQSFLTGGGVAASVLAAGAFSTVFQVSAGPFFMRNSGEKERLLLFSLNGALSMLTGVVGSVLGGVARDLLAPALSDGILAYRIALLAGAGFAALAALPFSRIEEEGPSLERGKGPALRIPEAALPAKEPGAWLYLRLLLPGFLTGMGAGLTIPYINLYFKNVFGLSDSAIGAAFAAGQIATFLGMIAGPGLARRSSKASLIFWTQAASVPFILILTWTRSLPLVLLAFLARQALMNLSTPVSDNFGLELVPPRRHHLFNALRMLNWTVSWMLAARVSGALIESRGFEASFTLTAILYSVSTGLFGFFFLGKRGELNRRGAERETER